MKIQTCILLIAILTITGCSRQPQTIEANDSNTRIQVCFTPGQDCTAMLVDTINRAQKSINVQAYSFTSYKIAKALVAAQERGVTVFVILDKSQFDGQHFSVAHYLYQHGITLYEDDTVNIANNKVMILDDSTVETGSFNFTKAVQTQNAENMLIIENPDVTTAYNKNWKDRKNQSKIVIPKIFSN